MARTRLLDQAITEHAMHLRRPATATPASQRGMQRDLTGHRRKEMQVRAPIQRELARGSR